MKSDNFRFHFFFFAPAFKDEIVEQTLPFALGVVGIVLDAYRSHGLNGKSGLVESLTEGFPRVHFFIVECEDEFFRRVSVRLLSAKIWEMA
jgi:hypothetical protein